MADYVLDTKIRYSNDTASLNRVQAQARRAMSSTGAFGVGGGGGGRRGGGRGATSQAFNLQRSLAGYNRALGATNVATKKVSVSTRQMATATQSYSRKAAQAAKNTNSWAKFMHAGALATRRWVAFLIGTTGIVAVIQGISQATDALMDFQSEMVRLGQLTGDAIDSKNIKEFETAARKSAKAWGVSSVELMQMSANLRQSGISSRDVIDSMDLLAKLRLNKQINDVNSLTDAMIVLRKSFKFDTAGVENTLGSMIAISKRYATTVEDIASSLSRAGGTFAGAGQDVNSLMALFTTARETTRLPAQSVSVGIRNIVSRIRQKPKTREAIEDVGVQVYNNEGKMRGILTILNEIDKVTRKMHGGDRAGIAGALGGIRQATTVNALLDNMREVNKIYAEAINNQADVTKDATIAQEALATTLQKVKEELAGVVAQFSDTGALKLFMDGILNITRELSVMATVFATLAAFKGIGFLAGKASGALTPIRPSVQFAESGHQIKSGAGLNQMLGGAYGSGKSSFRPPVTTSGFGSAGTGPFIGPFQTPSGFGSTAFTEDAFRRKHINRMVSGNVVPGSTGIVPGSSGIIPSTRGIVPGSRGVVPGSRGSFGSDTRFTMPGFGGEGFVPGSRGTVPGSRGVVPSAISKAGTSFTSAIKNVGSNISSSLVTVGRSIQSRGRNFVSSVKSGVGAVGSGISRAGGALSSGYQQFQTTPFYQGLAKHKATIGTGGALLAFGAAGSYDVKDRSSAAAKSGLEGAGAAFAGLALGLNPVVAILGGLAVGLSSFDSAIREADQRMREAFLEKQQTGLSGVLERQGFSAQSRQRLNQIVAQSEKDRVAARSEPGNISIAIREVKNTLGRILTVGSVKGTGNAIVQLERESFAEYQNMAKNYKTTVVELTNSIKESGMSFDELKAKHPDVIKNMQELWDKYDDGTVNQSINVEDYLKGVLDVTDATEKLNKEREAEAKAQQALAERLEKNASILDSVLNKKAVAVSAFAGVAASSYAFRKQSAEFSGRSFSDAGYSNRTAIGQARALAGTSNTMEIRDQILNLLNLKKGASEGERGIIEARTSNLRRALDVLSDSSSRTASAFDALSSITNEINSKLGVVEGFYSADAEGRARMKEDREIARKVIKSGTLKGFDIEEQQASLRYLKRYSGVKIMGDLTGEAIKNSILKKTSSKFLEGDFEEREKIRNAITGISRDSLGAEKVKAEVVAGDYTIDLVVNKKAIMEAGMTISNLINKALLNIPKSIDMNATHNVNVNLIGASSMGLTVANKLKEGVVDFVVEEVMNELRRKMPQAGL